MFRYIVQFLAILCLCWLARPVWAQPAGGQDKEALARQHYDLAESYKARGLYREAVEQYLKAYELLPRSSLIFNAAQAYWLADEHDKALVQYARYLQVDPSGPGGPIAREQFYRAGELAWGKEEHDRAMALYRRYLELAPSGPFAEAARERFYDVAERDWERGTMDAALGGYERYLELAPAGKSAEAARERFYDAAERAGDDEKARGYYERYLAIAPSGRFAGRARERIAEIAAAKAAREAPVEPLVRDEPELQPLPRVERRAARSVQWSGALQAAFDYKARGAAALVGIGLGVGERVEVRAAGVVGPTFGMYLGGVVYLRGGMLRPLVGMGVPMFFSGGVRVGARGSVGLEWVATERVSASVELGGEWYVNAEIDREDMALVPMVGVRAHL